MRKHARLAAIGSTVKAAIDGVTHYSDGEGLDHYLPTHPNPRGPVGAHHSDGEGFGSSPSPKKWGPEGLDWGYEVEGLGRGGRGEETYISFLIFLLKRRDASLDLP